MALKFPMQYFSEEGAMVAEERGSVFQPFKIPVPDDERSFYVLATICGELEFVIAYLQGMAPTDDDMRYLKALFFEAQDAVSVQDSGAPLLTLSFVSRRLVRHAQNLVVLSDDFSPLPDDQ